MAVCAGNPGLTTAERAELLTVLAEDSHDLVPHFVYCVLLSLHLKPTTYTCRRDTAPAGNYDRSILQVNIEPSLCSSPRCKHLDPSYISLRIAARLYRQFIVCIRCSPCFEAKDRVIVVSVIGTQIKEYIPQVAQVITT